MENSLLFYKRILIVDDESDVLDTLEDILSKCDIVRATTFEEAKGLLETQYFDMAILDIMGVDGYKLLEIANKKKVIAVMLTAHALSPESTVKSFKEGAAYYVPKEEMGNIPTYLNDILEAKLAGEKPWSRWMTRFVAYYDTKFGPKWQEDHKEFWDAF
ncbi:response regulator [Thermodesulfobacteriota bacterium]